MSNAETSDEMLTCAVTVKPNIGTAPERSQAERRYTEGTRTTSEGRPRNTDAQGAWRRRTRVWRRGLRKGSLPSGPAFTSTSAAPT
ncbi:hypothetical protein BYT27DRAFT_6517269 [Phlegmacium glaucopus]|nr:hypothetical protein BYT27DRAFT_6517269 [Phlegmacium glaucopus]